jgi:hypothetical protein
MNVIRKQEYLKILDNMRHPQQRSWIMLNPTSIGDTATVCALAGAFLKQHGHAITMVVPPDHLPIALMYPHRLIRIVPMDRPSMLSFINNYMDVSKFELDIPFCAHPYDHGDGRLDQIGYLLKYPGRGGLTFTDTIRYLLRLPWNSELERPTIPAEWTEEAQRFAAEVGMIPGKSVTLFPASSSPVPQFPDMFWATLVDRLNARGYKVFCNMKGGNVRPATMPIPGTIPIEVPVHLALPLVKIAGRTISSANGLQFLQLLGGEFEQMTALFRLHGNGDDFEMNSRIYSAVSPIHQFIAPELCLDTPFSEYAMPINGTEEDYTRIALAVANDDQTDRNCFKRGAENGMLYTEANREWLSELVGPMKN